MLLGVYDVENDPLSVSSFMQPAHGTAVLNRDGTFTYTPERQYAGVDEFAFTISDDRGGASTATMHVRGHPAHGSVVDDVLRGPRGSAGGRGSHQPRSGTTVPRAADWDGDGKVDLIVAAQGHVWLHRNAGTANGPAVCAGRQGSSRRPRYRVVAPAEWR